jgi:hypothetical protein
MQSFMGHCRIEMAGSSGGQLDDGDTLGPDTISVPFGFYVSFDDSDFDVAPQFFDGMFQEGRFPGPRAADKVDGHCAHGLEVFPIDLGQGIVGCKKTGMDIDFFRG